MRSWEGAGVPARHGGTNLPAGQQEPCFHLEHSTNNLPDSAQVGKALGAQHTLGWGEEEPSTAGPPGVPWTSLLEQLCHSSIYCAGAPELKALLTSTFPCIKLFK